jgi:hypothetical protein
LTVPDDVDYAELFSALCAEYSGVTGVSVPEAGGGRGFGSNAIKINNRIFAMLAGGRLVVKLPRARVTELIETGHAQPFDGGKGAPMKEWVTLSGDEAECRALVVEAQAFVG